MLTVRSCSWLQANPEKLPRDPAAWALYTRCRPHIRRDGDIIRIQEMFLGGLEQHNFSIGLWPVHNWLLDTSCERGFLEGVEFFLSAGADAHRANRIGYQPVHIAAYYGHFDVLQRLVAAGADVNALNYDGETAFDSAAHGTAEGCAVCAAYLSTL